PRIRGRWRVIDESGSRRGRPGRPGSEDPLRGPELRGPRKRDGDPGPTGADLLPQADHRPLTWRRDDPPSDGIETDRGRDRTRGDPEGWRIPRFRSRRSRPRLPKTRVSIKRARSRSKRRSSRSYAVPAGG